MDIVGIGLFLVPLAFVVLAAYVARGLLDQTSLLGRMLLPSAVLVSVGFTIVTVWLRRRRDTPGEAQLRLAPRGYATRLGYGPVRWKPWPRRLRVRGGDQRLIMHTVLWGVPLVPVLTFRLQGAPDDASRAIELARRYASRDDVAAEPGGGRGA